MEKKTKKSIVVPILSLISVIVYALVIEEDYRVSFNELLTFLSFIVVLISMTFSTKWKWAFLNLIIALLVTTILIYFLWWFENMTTFIEFAFENTMDFSPIIIGGIQGIILGIVLRFFYTLSQKTK